MSRGPQPPAPHVQAAIRRHTAAAGAAGPAQARPPVASRTPAPHVEAAVERGRGAAGGVQPAPGPPAPAAHVLAATGGRGAPAPPVQTRTAGPPGAGAASGEGSPARASVAEYVTYVDVKSPTTPPPPPRGPVYELHCADGAGCSVRDVKTGRVRPAGDLFGGFVRMSRSGPVYVSPRAAVGAPGDSHPTIASVTPEERTGRKALLAAGEVGILDGEIVGHNDKTGHYLTRRNYWQSGMPPERFHPFTEDPKEWYKRPSRPVKGGGPGSGEG